jgi:hypothetical protein
MIYHVPAANRSRYFRRSADAHRLIERYAPHWRWYRAGIHIAIAVAIIGGVMVWAPPG